MLRRTNSPNGTSICCKSAEASSSLPKPIRQPASVSAVAPVKPARGPKRCLLVHRPRDSERWNGATTPVLRLRSELAPGITPSDQQLSTMDFYLDSSTLLPVAITFSALPDNDATTNLLVEADFANYQTINGAAVRGTAPDLRVRETHHEQLRLAGDLPNPCSFFPNRSCFSLPSPNLPSLQVLMMTNTPTQFWDFFY